ncbi:MAG: hypothetical protein ACM3UU_11790 [Ignavibacteriales bacterium]
MDNNEIDQVKLLEPWELIKKEKLSIEQELQKEICDRHVLFGLKVEAVARRYDQDDFLFYLPDYQYKCAVVHLTWNIERDVMYPRTKLYLDIEDWKVKCMVKDYFDITEEIDTFNVIQARNRIKDEIALFGSCSKIIKPGTYLMDTLDLNIVFKVKGIEHLSYIDKSQNDINPWIVIETNKVRPEDLINRKFHIIG